MLLEDCSTTEKIIEKGYSEPYINPWIGNEISATTAPTVNT
tara:strand:- start:1306 stop:1428 length:123 start_codon:yes stop_codon:yes gene_type:complete